MTEAINPRVRAKCRTRALGKRLRWLRLSQGMGLKTCARALGLIPSALAALESGAVLVDQTMAQRIAAIFDVPAEAFL